MMNRRENQRLDSDRMAECRTEGRTFKAVLYNVSTTGCMIEMSFCQVSESDRIYLKVEGNIRVGGVIVWLDGKNAGIRFDEPLHEAVVRFLGYDPASRILMLPTDRFGRPLPKLPKYVRA